MNKALPIWRKQSLRTNDKICPHAPDLATTLPPRTATAFLEARFMELMDFIIRNMNSSMKNLKIPVPLHCTYCDVGVTNCQV